MSKNELPKNRLGKVPIKHDPVRKCYVLTYFPDGKRKRISFDKKSEAEKEWKRHKRVEARYGNQATEYDRDAHIEYSEAKRIAPGIDLRDMARFWNKHHPNLEEAPTVKSAIERFQAQKSVLNRSHEHRRTLKSHLKAFEVSFGKIHIDKLDSITIDDKGSSAGTLILEWLLALENQPRTIWNYYISLCNLFNWCERRKWIARAPTRDISEEDLPTVPKKPKGVLTIKQVASMMVWVEEHRPYFVAWYALQLFGGLRHAEADRFQWEWVDFKRKLISIPGWFFEDGEAPEQGTKTQDDWVMDGLPANLWAWLKKYHEESGKVRSPTNKAISRMRNHFKDEDQIDPIIDPWPPNAMRHTFCTMMISIHQSADKVSLWSRHKNTTQLYNSYVVRLLQKKEAMEYLKIKPKASQK